MNKQQQSLTDQEQQFIRNIGFKIQYYRKRSGLSQPELAERSGFSNATISHIESTQTYGLSLIAVYRIAHALNVEPYQLLQD